MSEEWNPNSLKNLRDELHSWTFENVGLIDETYRRVFSFTSDRNQEIAAPLKVFADLAGNEELKTGLKRALEFHNSTPDADANPIELLKETVKRLTVFGYTKLSPTHISLEMKNLALERPSLLFDDNPKWESLVWIGRQLRSLGLVENNAPDERYFLHGKYLRIYPLSEIYLENILKDNSANQNSEPKNPLDFCSICDDCKYRNEACSIRESRYKTKIPKRNPI